MSANKKWEGGRETRRAGRGKPPRGGCDARLRFGRAGARTKSRVVLGLLSRLSLLVLGLAGLLVLGLAGLRLLLVLRLVVLALRLVLRVLRLRSVPLSVRHTLRLVLVLLSRHRRKQGQRREEEHGKAHLEERCAEG